MDLTNELVALMPKLRAYAWMLTWGAVDADDLVAEALRRAWRGRSSLTPGVSTERWMFRILRTVCLTSLAGGLPGTRAGQPEATSGAAEGPFAEGRAPFRGLLSTLAELPEQDREALLLVVGSGLSYAEAADVCYCSVSMIKARVSRARARLAELVDAAPSPYAPRSQPASSADLRMAG